MWPPAWRPSASRANFLMMKSNGGLVDHRAASAKPVDLLVSGPVGGVLSALYFGRLVGRQNLISMDMGGTSFDVSLIADGEATARRNSRSSGACPFTRRWWMSAPSGAGGGSVAWIDKGGLLRVGPRSAGANPDRPATSAAVRRPRDRRQCGAGAHQPRQLLRRGDAAGRRGGPCRAGPARRRTGHGARGRGHGRGGPHGLQHGERHPACVH